jgi:hypothetical protein
VGLSLFFGLLGAENSVRSKSSDKELETPVSELLLWVGLLLPPLTWSVYLEVLYLFSDYGCANRNFVPNHIVSIAFLVVSLLGFAIAWSNWQKSGSTWPDDKSGSIPRSRFMSALGLLSGALFSTLIFAQWLPTLLGVPCGK